MANSEPVDEAAAKAALLEKVTVMKGQLERALEKVKLLERGLKPDADFGDRLLVDIGLASYLPMMMEGASPSIVLIDAMRRINIIEGGVAIDVRDEPDGEFVLAVGPKVSAG